MPKSDSKQWINSKEIGSVAEDYCRFHFETLGYSVENFGIEHTFPEYLRHSKNHNSGEGLKAFTQAFKKMPDFLISGTCPTTSTPRPGEYAGKTEAFLVEAKFNSDDNLIQDEFNNHIKDVYQNFLVTLKLPLVIYLVAKNFTRSSGSKKSEAYVHLGLFNLADIEKHEIEHTWITIGEKSLWKLPFTYARNGSGLNFNTVYENKIHDELHKRFFAENPSLVQP